MTFTASLNKVPSRAEPASLQDAQSYYQSFDPERDVYWQYDSSQTARWLKSQLVDDIELLRYVNIDELDEGRVPIINDQLYIDLPWAEGNRLPESAVACRAISDERLDYCIRSALTDLVAEKVVAIVQEFADSPELSDFRKSVEATTQPEWAERIRLQDGRIIVDHPALGGLVIEINRDFEAKKSGLKAMFEAMLKTMRRAALIELVNELPLIELVEIETADERLVAAIGISEPGQGPVKRLGTVWLKQSEPRFEIDRIVKYDLGPLENVKFSEITYERPDQRVMLKIDRADLPVGLTLENASLILGRSDDGSVYMDVRLDNPRNLINQIEDRLNELGVNVDPVTQKCGQMAGRSFCRHTDNRWKVIFTYYRRGVARCYPRYSGRGGGISCRKLDRNIVRFNHNRWSRAQNR